MIKPKPPNPGGDGDGARRGGIKPLWRSCTTAYYNNTTTSGSVTPYTTRDAVCLARATGPYPVDRTRSVIVVVVVC